MNSLKVLTDSTSTRNYCKLTSSESIMSHFFFYCFRKEIKLLEYQCKSLTFTEMCRGRCSAAVLPTGRPEICAYGFRNPWRCGFDRLTDVLYCGDVGHTDVEAVKIVE